MLIGFLLVGKARRNVFKQQWLEENFSELHETELTSNGV
jgi:hypothetical protein